MEGFLEVKEAGMKEARDLRLELVESIEKVELVRARLWVEGVFDLRPRLLVTFWILDLMVIVGEVLPLVF